MFEAKKAELVARHEKAKADAEAEANKKIRESITSELIEYNKIEKWNGQQPNVVGGGSSAIIVDTTK